MEAAPGNPVRIDDPGRAVVGLMRRRHRLGGRLPHGALHRYLRRPDVRSGELLRLATALGVFGPVRLALVVATAG